MYRNNKDLFLVYIRYCVVFGVIASLAYSFFSPDQASVNITTFVLLSLLMGTILASAHIMFRKWIMPEYEGMESNYQIKNSLISTILKDPMLMITAIFGGLSILIIPIYALIDWNHSCEQELLADISTILSCLPPILVGGLIAGALWGIAGKEIGNMLSDSALQERRSVFGRIIGLVLALIFCIFGSLLPSFVLVFRECGQTFP